jgi:hypothetical protein
VRLETRHAALLPTQVTVTIAVVEALGVSGRVNVGQRVARGQHTLLKVFSLAPIIGVLLLIVTRHRHLKSLFFSLALECHCQLVFA